MVTPATELTMDTDSKLTSNNSESSCVASSSTNESRANEFHSLRTKWNLWAHLPHETDWSAKSYKQIYKFETVEETIAIVDSLPESLVKNCMLFIMKDGIIPMWEDPKNRNGGCFSYKVSNKDVPDCWRQLSYVLVGNSISPNKTLLPVVNGITISPKKNFCIVKIWLANCKFQNAAVINEVVGINPHGCLFKKHTPEY